MSVTISQHDFDAKVGPVYLTRDLDRPGNVCLKAKDQTTYVPVRSLIEAIEAMCKPEPGAIDRYALVRDEENHHPGSTWFLEECSVRPGPRGRVRLRARVSGTVRVTVRAKPLLRALRALNASTGESDV